MMAYTGGFLGSAGTGLAPLPFRAYPIEAERQLIRDYKVPQYLNPEQHGVTLNQEGRMFRAAIDAGLVPPTAEGLETLLAWFGAGSAARSAAGLEYFTRWIGDFLASDAEAPGAPVTPQPVAEMVRHPVIGADVPAAEVIYHGPHPDRAGWMLFEMTGGRRWEYPGPDWVAPPEADRTRKADWIFVLAEPVAGQAEREIIALRTLQPMTDGGMEDSGWRRFAGWSTPAALQAQYAGSVNRLTILLWETLSAAERDAITAALAPSGWTPVGPGGAVVPSGPAPGERPPIPPNPGGVTFVPPPGSPDPITVVKPTGEIDTIPTPTSTHTTPRVTPEQVPEVLRRVPPPSVAPAGAVVTPAAPVGAPGRGVLALLAAGLVALAALARRRRS